MDMIKEAGLSTITPVLVTNEEVDMARLEENKLIVEKGEK